MERGVSVQVNSEGNVLVQRIIRHRHTDRLYLYRSDKVEVLHTLQMLHTHTHSHTLKRTLIQTSLPCRVGTRGKGLQYARISSCVLCVWSMQVCIFFYYAGCHTSLQTEICTHMQQSRPYLHIASLNVHSWAKAANFMKENHRWAIYSQNYPTRVQEWTLVWSKFHCIRKGYSTAFGVQHCEVISIYLINDQPKIGLYQTSTYHWCCWGPLPAGHK